MFVETLLRRVVDLAEEYPRGEVPDRVLWEEPDDNYEEYIEAAKRLVEQHPAAEERPS